MRLSFFVIKHVSLGIKITTPNYRIQHIKNERIRLFK